MSSGQMVKNLKNVRNKIRLSNICKILRLPSYMDGWEIHKKMLIHSTLFMPKTFMYVHGLSQKRARAQFGSKSF